MGSMKILDEKVAYVLNVCAQYLASATTPLATIFV